LRVSFRKRPPSSPEGAAASPLEPSPRADPGVTTPLLEVSGVSKRFGGNLALDDVSLAFLPGRIHALLGENGAGKTTLTRIVAGVLAPDTGDLRLRGERLVLHSPAQALALGIGLIHQELSLVSGMSVAANVFLGREPRTSRGTIDDRKMRQHTAALLDWIGASFAPTNLVDDLSIAQQQLVEIARVLDREPDLLIMDEPTASLSTESVERLFEIVRSLRDRGVAIVYISHELEEVFAIADQVTVLKDGRLMMSKPNRKTNQQEVVRMMVGRQLDELFPKRVTHRREGQAPVLAVSDLSLPGHFEDVSFELHSGEVLGLAGLIGAGRSALVQSLFGAPPHPFTHRDIRGTIRINGRPAVVASPRRAISQGLGLVPEDRKTEGLLLELALSENIVLPQLAEIARWGIVRWPERMRISEKQIAQLRIVTTSARAHVNSLSGGNQQKVVLAKWLAKRCSVLLLDEPTRGVDVGAKTEIYALIRDLVAHDAAILLISSSLPEILGLSDRVIVMSKGRLVHERKVAETTEEELLKAALGLAAEERSPSAA